MILGTKHLSEIALMSIDLLNFSSSIEVPKSYGTHLQIRIGLHTGPVLAGVVGYKIPRYCILGNTVNTTNYLMTTGNGTYIYKSNIYFKL